MKKVAALYMCTGQYLKLWPEFLASAEKYLLKQCEVHYFVFTDADHLEGEESNSRVHRIFQKPTYYRCDHGSPRRQSFCHINPHSH